MDETRIDTAPTPAHVFAYRAFRSVFVTSPESSPVHPRDFDYEQHRDKENATRSPARPSRFATSPVKAKRKDAEHNAPRLDHDLILTPKKQKTVPVSPTKSILKKSHVLTPRRAELRDVTVTFKDIRQSVSPEMLRQGSPVRVRSQQAIRTLMEDVTKQKPVVVEKAKSNSAPPVPALVHSSAKPMQDADFDLDAYRARTEKEMRRLIKYGQKWKEQAKRRDEDNMKLTILLEETRKENERLEKKIAQLQQSKETKNTMNPSNAAAEEKSRSKSTTDHNHKMREGHAAKPYLRYNHESHEHHPIVARQTSLQQQLDELQHLQPSPPTPPAPKEELPQTNSPQTRAPSLRTKIHLLNQATSEKERHLLHQAQTEREKNVPGAAITFEPTVEDNAEQKISVPLRTASLSVVEDRKAAARERLNRKREARAASSQCVLNIVNSQKRLPNLSKMEVDESQVDWMAV